jgi:hypothetical protein
MNMSLIQIMAAVPMIAVTAAMVVAYRRYLATNSERRMQAMLDAVGLNPALDLGSDIATIRDIETVMREARHRCRNCTAEDVCERWLRGEQTGSSDFCPNSGVFGRLEK